MKKIFLLLAFAAGIGAAAAQKGDTLYIQRMPTFRGKEMAAFTEWVQARIRYPQEALRQGHGGIVNVQLIIQPDGSINDIKALGDPDASLAGEAIRVVSSSPRWKPGVQGIELKDGTVIVPVEPVPVRIVVPVNFLDPQKAATM